MAADTAHLGAIRRLPPGAGRARRRVKFYARNDQLGFAIPYDYMGVGQHYEPDFLVRLGNDVTLLLEIGPCESSEPTMCYDTDGLGDVAMFRLAGAAGGDGDPIAAARERAIGGTAAAGKEGSMIKIVTDSNCNLTPAGNCRQTDIRVAP